MMCVGTAKSGTHSIAALFDDPVRSAHEATADGFLDRILRYLEGRLPPQELTSYLHRRNTLLRLDVDSSQLNFFVLDILLREFETARFLLTIRDAYSWLNSFIDDSLRRTTSGDWIRLREARFRSAAFTHPAEERELEQLGLYTLDGYLSYWRMHNEKVLGLVPASRLLVVRTDQIAERSFEIADFAGLSRSSVRPEKAHAFRNPHKFHVLKKLNRDYLESKVASHCKPLMDLYFPDIREMPKSLL